MQITVNGEPHTIADNATVADLLVELEMPRKYVAVERNLELVPRAQHADCRLNEGDSLEIVTLVGGG